MKITKDKFTLAERMLLEIGVSTKDFVAMAQAIDFHADWKKDYATEVRWDEYVESIASEPDCRDGIAQEVFDNVSQFTAEELE